MTNRVIVTIELDNDVEIQLPEGARVVSIYSPGHANEYVPWVDDKTEDELMSENYSTFRKWVVE